MFTNIIFNKNVIYFSSIIFISWDEFKAFFSFNYVKKDT